jgi:dolichyl-phosphate-mannose-protein mannosyltransferase
MIWYSSTMCIAIYVAVRGLLILRAKRGYRDFDSSAYYLFSLALHSYTLFLAKVVKYDSLIGFLFIGWGLHYFPFFLMSRQLFLHHYFPALYFAILLSCVLFDLGTSNLRSRTRLQIAAVLVILAILNYQYLSPLTYGSPWTRSKCENAKWLKTWDFSWYVRFFK